MQRFEHQHTFPVFDSVIKPHPSKLLKKLRGGSCEVFVQDNSGSSLLKLYDFVYELITTVSPYGVAVV